MSTLAPRRVVTLFDEESGDKMEMEIYLELSLEGDPRVYALLVPLDMPVEVYETRVVDGADVLDPVEPKALGDLRKHVTEALRQWEIKAAVRGGEMFLVGDPPESFYADCESIEVDTDEGSEEFLVLVQLETGDQAYLVITPVVPDLTPAQLTADGARALTDKELAELEETFHAALQQMDEEDDDD